MSRVLFRGPYTRDPTILGPHYSDELLSKVCGCFNALAISAMRFKLRYCGRRNTPTVTPTVLYHSTPRPLDRQALN